MQIHSLCSVFVLRPCADAGVGTGLPVRVSGASPARDAGQVPAVLEQAAATTGARPPAATPRVPSGPSPLRQGWVWREAREGYTVASAAGSGACACRQRRRASRRVAAGGSPPPAPTPPPATAGERVGGWSTWGRKAGVEYRYRLRWNPADHRPGALLRVDYDLRNTRARRWQGAVRSVDCERNVLAMSRAVTLQPKGSGQAVLATPNCGTAEQPFFKPDVVESGRID